jgi:dTDP-glucose 4,6-dehydratase
MAERVLVTGADGFIGSHLVDRLVREGFTVRAFVQYNARNTWGWIEDLPPDIGEAIEVFAADLRDPFVVRKATTGCRRVFHLGALIAIPYSYVAPREYVDTNVHGTLNVMQAALDEGVDRVIHTSTSEVYGTARYVPIDENHPLQGQSPYSASKIGADKIAESYHLSFGLPVTTIRPFNTYGPRQSARAVIPTIITQVLADRPEIKLGALHPVRDLTHVADTVDGFVRAAASAASVGEVINLGQGSAVSVADLAERILDLMHASKPIVADPQRVRPERSEVLRLICDNRKAAALIGWAPARSLDQGLEDTIGWFRDHLALYKPAIYNL